MWNREKKTSLLGMMGGGWLIGKLIFRRLEGIKRFLEVGLYFTIHQTFLFK